MIAAIRFLGPRGSGSESVGRDHSRSRQRLASLDEGMGPSPAPRGGSVLGAGRAACQQGRGRPRQTGQARFQKGSTVSPDRIVSHGRRFYHVSSDIAASPSTLARFLHGVADFLSGLRGRPGTLSVSMSSGPYHRHAAERARRLDPFD